MEKDNMEILDELVDLYDSKSKPLGISKKLELVHQDGDWHKTFHCWIINSIADHGSLLLQWRGAWKRNWPNRLDTSAAGHYAAGEGLEGGLRELKEELGITVRSNQLISAGVRVAVEEFELGVRNHEFQDVCFLIDDRPIEEYEPQFPEVGGLIFIPISAGLKLLAGETEFVFAKGFKFNNSNHHNREYKDFKIVREHFIPSIDQFTYKCFILADRILRGDKYFQI